VESKKIAFTKNDPHAILDFFDMVLAFSNYPPLFPQSYEIDYDEGKRDLVIDYLLPPLKVLPRLQAVNYDKDADAFYESVLEEDERNQKYAQLLHEMPLRNFYEIFTADKSETVAAVQFRGYLYLQQDAKSGGTPSCVLAIRAERDSFLTLNLAECDPLDAFTELGGTIQANE
jgi:restriction system protein